MTVPVALGSQPRKGDQEVLVESRPRVHERRRSSLLAPYFVAIIIIVFITATYFAHNEWERRHPGYRYKSRMVVIPEFERLKIEIEGQINVKTVDPRTLPNNPICSDVEDVDKFDCHPETNSTQDSCTKRGCCWNVPKEENGTRLGLNTPYCYFPSQYPGYELFKYAQFDDAIKASFRRNVPTGLPKEVQEIHLEITPIDATRLRIKITDAKAERYETPYPIISSFPRGKVSDRKYNVKLDLEGHLVVTRKSTGVKIIDTQLSNMIYTDQLLQLNIKVPSNGFYGLCEHQDRIRVADDWSRFTFINDDEPPHTTPHLYCSHPFYFQMENDTKSHGVFLLNSNIMEIITQPTPGITFRPIGGVFDFYVMLGDGPADVVKQYQGLVGYPAMPPYWSLGFHLCKFGYGSLNKTKAAYQRTKDAKIPFDAQWSDIDYMDRNNDYTYDKVKFAGLPEFADQLHAEGMHYVVIMDVGVSGSEKRGSYAPFDDGVQMDIFIKNASGEILYGKVFNEVSTVYIDFNHPRANEYNVKQYANLYNQVKFDGIWVDMNEPSNFKDGSLWGCPKDNELENPPYVPPGAAGDNGLSTGTICMSAHHYATSHYNLHNLHGLTSGISTNYALRQLIPGKRPFVISHQTFAGQGVYTGHWSGDISSNWEHIKYTIPATLNAAMFGIPMMGNDICGFHLNTTVELCARWHSLGAFYPFSRNHNSNDTKDQDPAALGESVVSSARKSLTIRYRLLPYLYTLFYRSHVYGETVFRPLFFEFPEDKNTHDIATTFLWGPAFLVVPVLEEGTTWVTTYVPNDVWYNYYDGAILPDAGSHVKFHANLDEINLLIRGGHILPCQEAALTTTKSRENNFNLIVALKDGQANGELYWDDGETLDAYEQKLYNLIHFEAKFEKGNFNLTSRVIYKGYDGNMFVDNVEIFGMPKDLKISSINGKRPSLMGFKTQKGNSVKFQPISLLENLDIVYSA